MARKINKQVAGVRAVLNAVKKMLYAFLLLVCAFLLVAAVWLAIDKFVNKSTVPSVAGYAILSVESGSMEGNMKDSIDKGDLILIARTGDYRIGETITFLRPGEKIPTTHRIIDFDDTSGVREYVTRGDANGLTRDANVTQDMVIGEVIYIFRGFGLLRSFLTDGDGYIFVLSFFCILAVGILLLKMSDDQEIALSDNIKTATGEDNTSENERALDQSGGLKQ